MATATVSKRYDAAAKRVEPEKPYSIEEALGVIKDMPAAKFGTVTFDVTRSVREAKAGKVEFRVDKAGNIHTPAGKRSFSLEHLAANANAVIEAIMRAKPAAAKGIYLRSLTVSTTMGPGVPVDA